MYKRAVRSERNRPTGRFLPRLLVTYALLTPVLVLPLPIGQSFGAVDLLFPLGIVALLQIGQKKNSVIFGWFALFSFLAFLSTATLLIWDPPFLTDDALSVLLIVRMFAIYLPMLLILTAEHIAVQDLRLIMKCLLASTTLSCVIGVSMYHLGIQVRDNQQRVWNESGSSLRAGGLLGNSGDMGHIAAALGAIACSIAVVHLTRRWLLIPMFALAAYVTIISSSRAALLFLIVSVGTMFVVYFRGSRIALVAFGIPAAIFAFVTLANDIGDSSSLDATVRRFDVLNLTGQSEFLSSGSRLASWNELGELIARYPLTGVGYGNAKLFFGSGDNSFLSILAETGIPAGIAYVAFWISILLTALRLPAGNGRVAAVALVFGEASFMLTVDTHRMWASTSVALLAIAIAIRYVQVGAEHKSKVLNSLDKTQLVGASR